MNIRRFLIFSFLLLSGLSVHSQTNNSGTTKGRSSGSVKGSIVDLTGKNDMSEATVSVKPIAADSADIQFVTTDVRGGFVVKNLHTGSYHLVISFEGYRHFRRDFTITSTN